MKHYKKYKLATFLLHTVSSYLWNIKNWYFIKSTKFIFKYSYFIDEFGLDFTTEKFVTEWPKMIFSYMAEGHTGQPL